MSITTDFDVLWTQKKQDDAIVQCKAIGQNIMNVVLEGKAQIDVIIATGVFAVSQMPASVSAALVKAKAVIDTAATGFNAADVREVLNWSGK